jgi:hypothetical protein
MLQVFHSKGRGNGYVVTLAGQGGFSDVEKFREIVARNPKIEVRLLDWYPD